MIIQHETELYLTIAEAARMVGVSPATLRAWERAGLIAPIRTDSGYRQFSATDLERLRRIRRLREMEKLSIPAIRAALGQPALTEERCRPPGQPRAHYGKQLRKLRQKRQLSLRQVAALTNLSPSFISSIERGVVNPSVSALQKLTAAYGISIVDLFGGSQVAPQVLVRPIDRRVYSGTVGVKMEQLNFGPHLMELHLFTVEPGFGSGEAYQHQGEEFIYMLQGTLEVWLDEMARYVLEPGDVLYFESTRLHRWLNIGEAPAVFLGVNTPPTF